MVVYLEILVSNNFSTLGAISFQEALGSLVIVTNWGRINTLETPAIEINDRLKSSFSASASLLTLISPE